MSVNIIFRIAAVWNSCNDPCAGLKTFRKRRTGIFDHTCRTDPCPWLGDSVYL